MKFDRKAGGGVEAVCRLDNGKVVLEWKFSFTDGDEAPEGERRIVRVRLTDRQGNVVSECAQYADEEDALQSVLLQPRLWSGIRHPYLYDMEALLLGGDGKCLDRICGRIPLRSVSGRKGGEEGMLLNDFPFTPRAVGYTFPPADSGAALQQMMLEDLGHILAVGANMVCIGKEKEELVGLFLPLCDRLGLLVCRECEKKIKGEIPVLRGGREALLLPGGKCPSGSFYRYKAKWSEEPFVYIVPESVKKLESGNYSVLCYSNSARVALYSDGVLFEFRRGEGEFAFHEIPAKGPCITLTAEGDGCSESFSVHKSFIRHSAF